MLCLMFTRLKKPLQSSSRNNSAQVSRQARKKKTKKNRPLTEPIRFQDMVNSALSQTWEKIICDISE